MASILNDRSHGSSILARDALNYFLSLPDKSLPARFEEGSGQLLTTFSCMGVFHRINQLCCYADSPSELRQKLVGMKKYLLDIPGKIGKVCLRGMKDDETILTLSYSGYVLESLKNVADAGLTFKVYILRSLPGREGERLAESLHRVGIRSHIIDDDNVEDEIRVVTKVLMGADMLTDEYFINKKLSMKVSCLSDVRGIPVWILADSMKYIGLPCAEVNTGELFEKIPYLKIHNIVSEEGIYPVGEFLQSSKCKTGVR